jgi:hypothetical protein
MRFGLSRPVTAIAHRRQLQRSARYADRLMLAHFAIITFALVASFGVSHTAQPNTSLTFGIVTAAYLLHLFVVCSLDRRFARDAWAFSRSDASLAPPTQEGHSVSRATLDYIQRANLIAGAPQRVLIQPECSRRDRGSTAFQASSLYFYLDFAVIPSVSEESRSAHRNGTRLLAYARNDRLCVYRSFLRR